MLRDSVVVVVRTHPRACEHAAIQLAMITMRKSHGFPFVSDIWAAYGAPLGGPSGRRSSANIGEMFDCRTRSIYDFVSGSSRRASKL